MALRATLAMALFLGLAVAQEELQAANETQPPNETVSLRGSLQAAVSSSWGSCTASYAHNCLDNPTCCDSGMTCYEKTPNWAACLPSCTPGMRPPNDDGKPYSWSCNMVSGGGRGGGDSWGGPEQGPPPGGRGGGDSWGGPQHEHRCEDQNHNCDTWSKSGECHGNPDYMLVMCRRACGAC